MIAMMLSDVLCTLTHICQLGLLQVSLALLGFTSKTEILVLHGSTFVHINIVSSAVVL